jgi:hypothetical protein
VLFAECILNLRLQGLAQFDRPKGKQTSKPVVDWLLKILLASEVSLCGKYRCVSEQKLNLFNLAAVCVTQLGTSSAKIVRSQMLKLHPFGTSPDDIPNDILGDSFSPWASVAANGPEDPACAYVGCNHPTIDRLFDQLGTGTVRM